MDTTELFQRLALALAIGLLIGLERGWQMRGEAEGERAAGLRTHALASLLGGVWGAIALRLETSAGVALGLAGVTLGGTIVLFRYRETIHDGTFGATTAVAALLAFALGALAVVGDREAAAAAGVAVAGLLALKGALHAWLRRLTWLELRSVLMIAAMSTILLPVLPDRAIDPLGAINPHEIWLLTVMLAVISFAGYLAIKLTGAQRGIALTGLAGGLASSTAVTLTLARMAGAHPERAGLMAGGALIAGATMMARVIVIVAVTRATLLGHLVLPLGLAAVASTVAGAYLVARADRATADDNDRIELGNPLDLASVLKFGALLTAVGLLARVTTQLAGSAGAYALAAISGVADVDAITLSMARLSGTLGAETAAASILLAVGVNTIAKAALAWSTGGAGIGRIMAIAAAVAIVAALAGYTVGPLPMGALLSKAS